MVRLSGCIIINHTPFPVSLGRIKGEKIFQYFVKEDYLLPHSALAVTNRIPIARDNGSYPHVADCDYFTVDKLYPDGGIIPCLLKRRSNTGAEIRGECLISTLQLYIKNIIKRNFCIHDLQYPARLVNPRDHAG